MNHKLLALACLGLLAVAGCQPEPAAPAAVVDTAAIAPPEFIPDAAAPESDGTPPFDQKGFAGTFSGTLPCTDCPGTDTTLTLAADGSFVLDEQQGANAPLRSSDGSWTVETGNQHIRLDPNSKAAEDRLYVIASKDRISQLDADGKPAASGLDYSLTRRVAQ